MQPPTNSLSATQPRPYDMPPLRPNPPPPNDLPLPMDFSAGGRFERFDRNKDGHINLAEFEELMFEWQRDRDCPTHLTRVNDTRSLFDRFDLNADGFLSRGDFLQLVAPQERELPTPSPGLTSTIPALRTPSPMRTESSEYNRYTWFDETVGVAVTVDGAEAARNAAHQVVPLQDAFEQRLGRLQEQLAVHLLPKRSRLQAQLSTIRSQIDEVVSGRGAVERETLADCDAIVDRLKAAESVRVAPLIQSASEVDSELLNIDKIKQEIDNTFVDQGSFGKTESMLRLIQNYPDLSRNVERIAARLNPTLKPLDPSASVFPRETKKRIDCLGREARYEEALAVKDRMIWEMLQERKALEEKLNEEKTLCEEYTSEMSSWVELTDRLSREVNHLRQVEASAKGLESDFEKLFEKAQDDQLELQLLRTQRKDFADLMEENCALRQQLGTMERRFRTQRMREAAETGDMERHTATELNLS